MKYLLSARNAYKLWSLAAWLSLGLVVLSLASLLSLHSLSPEFDPAWRMVSEYAYGHYSWVLSMMFLTWGFSAWALAYAIWPQVHTKAGKVGLWFLLVAGLGEAMASVYDITHTLGHNVAGLLGIGGFPVAALLLSVSLGRNQAWTPAKKRLLWLANLNWISVVLLGLTLALMTAQFIHAYGGKLPTHAPAQLPAGVTGLDGWADRLIVLTNYLWVASVAWQMIKVQGNNSVK